MKEIILVRHGETDFNVQGLATGRMNISINIKGQQQAKIVGQYLKQFNRPKIECIWTSDLKRTQETAQIIANEINYKGKFTILPQLGEYGKGLLEGDTHPEAYTKADKEEEDYDNKYKKDPIGWFKNRTKFNNQMIKKYKQETNSSFNKRLEYIIDHIENSKCKKILIVSHGKTINFLVRHIFGIRLVPLGKGNKPMGNCSITYLIYNDKEWELVIPMSTSHLE